MRTCLAIGILSSLLALSACQEFALDERFYDDRLTNWTAVDDPDTVEGPSKWVVEKDGWLRERSNIWGRRGDFLGRWYGTHLVAGRTDWRDYRLQVRARPGDDDGFGVVFRFADPEHFYRLIFLQDGFNGGPLTRLDKRQGADYTELWSTNKGFRVGAEMLIEVEAAGDRITAAVDGRQLFELQDNSYKQGKVGLFSYAQSEQSFDDVKVRLK